MQSAALSRIGLAGLAVMGQNLALNIACNNVPISIYNRTASKVDETEHLAESEGGALPLTGCTVPLFGYHTPRDFVLSIRRPRSVIIMVKAGSPVDQTIEILGQFMEPGDCIIDGGNEWYENTERRIGEAQRRGLLYLGMGVSGGEYGAKFGPSLMPGGSLEAYNNVKDILMKIAAQIIEGEPVDIKRLIDDVRQALYASKIRSYAQGMNLLRAKSKGKIWNLNLGVLARIWKGGCIVRDRFLDRIKKAYENNKVLLNLIVDLEFAEEMVERQGAWSMVVGLAVESDTSMSASLSYFDTYRRARLPANLVQAQRDLFGAHL